MAPNLLLKAGFVRGDYDSNEGVDEIRTDFILQNFYFNLIEKVYNFKPVPPLENGSNFRPIPAVNSKEKKVLMVFEAVIEEFRDLYGSSVQEMATKVKNVSVDLQPRLLRSVSAELFSEGVSWSRIIGFFVFVGELALLHVPNDKSGDVINKLYESFCRHVKETLMTWIEEHGGWEGVETLNIKNSPAPKIDTTTSSDKGWYKNFATGAFRVVGTLFQLASPHVQSYA